MCCDDGSIVMVVMFVSPLLLAVLPGYLANFRAINIILHFLPCSKIQRLRAVFLAVASGIKNQNVCFLVHFHHYACRMFCNAKVVARQDFFLSRQDYLLSVNFWYSLCIIIIMAVAGFHNTLVVTDAKFFCQPSGLHTHWEGFMHLRTLNS